MKLDKVGSIQIRVPGDNRLLKYCSTRGHLNCPSEHKVDGHRFDMEVQLLHELCETNQAHIDIRTPQYAIISVLFKKEDPVDALSAT
jgi:carbonic anhydrase